MVTGIRSTSRAEKPEKIADDASRYTFKDISIFRDIEDIPWENFEKHRLHVLVTGSSYLVGEVMKRMGILIR